LLGHAEAIESRLRAAEADFRAYAAGHAGSLRVGIYQSVANKILPDVLRRFRARWPQVDVEVTEAMVDYDLVEAVERGDVDLSFAIQPISEGPFEVRELMSDPYVLVVAAGSPLAHPRPRAADLDGLPMIGYQHGKHQDHAEDFLRARGVRPRVVFRSNDNGTVQAILPLQEAIPPRVLAILWHRDRYRPPAAAAFVETAVAVASEIERAHDAFMAKVARSRRRAPGRRPRLPASRPA
jgi:DNA-binding transcriptional LysR family regulator